MNDPHRDPRGGAEDIAIVGMSCIVPRADTPALFWQNIVDRVDCIGDPPASWRPSWYEPGDASASMPVYVDKGGYLDDLCRFDPARYGVVPSGVDGSEPDQFLALRCAFEALADAGAPTLPLNRERTAVILGRGSFINRGILNWISHGFVVDQVVSLLRRLEPGREPADLEAIRAELKRQLPPFHAETAAGVTPCVLVGRIANRLDLKGPTYTLDAACASTLLAVEHGIRELRSGRCDAVLAGGVQVSTPLLIHQLFCRIEGLSRSGVVAPLSSEAQGTLLGEGCGMLVLKRRGDAEREGHRVYALIRDVGVSCDGRGAGLLAPRSEGQQLALRRAYELAGVPAATIGLIEAHATGIPVGDRTEVESLAACYGERTESGATIALGSVKSMIGHLLPASGAAALIKAALALYHRTIPPTLHAERPNPDLGLDRTPFYLANRTRPWFHGDLATPRRAGVNAFGFGGINAHAILEEFPADETALDRLDGRWPAELVVVSAPDREALRAKAASLAEWAEGAGAGVRLLDVAAACASDPGRCRLSVVAADLDELTRKLRHAAGLLQRADARRVQDRSGIFWYDEPLAEAGRTAFLFSGAGSQYPNMLADLCRAFPEARRQFDLADAAYARMGRAPLSRRVFPLPEDAHAAEASLVELEAGMTSVMAAERAILAVLASLGVRAEAVLGHSNGEFVALQAAGAFRVAGDESLIESIILGADLAARTSAPGLLPDVVLMAVEGADRDAVEGVVAESGGRVVVAIDNCPNQLVLAGESDAIEHARGRLLGKGGFCERLPVKALHTEAFAPACDVTEGIFRSIRLEPPKLELWSCTLAGHYPSRREEVEELAVRQLQRPVRFRETVEAMYAAGIRVFVEVGPRGLLSAFVGDTLGKRPHAAIPIDAARRHGLEQLCRAVGMLVAHGVPLDLPALYRRRGPRPLDLTAGAAAPVSAGPILNQALPELRLDEHVLAGLLERWPGRPTPDAKPNVPPIDRGRPLAEPSHDADSDDAPDELSFADPGDLGPMPPLAPAPAAADLSGARARANAEIQRTMRRFLEVQERAGLARFRKPAPGHAPDPSRGAATGPALDKDRGRHNGHGVAIRPARAASTGTSPTPAARPELGPKEAGPPPSRRLPLLGMLLTHEPGRRLLAECVLDFEVLPFLADHAFFGRGLSVDDPSLTGLPVMPLAMTLELMAEAAVALRPGMVVSAVREVFAHRWLDFFEPSRRVRTEATAADGDDVRVVVTEADREGMGAVIAEAVIELSVAAAELGPPRVPDAATTPFPFPPDVGHFGRSQSEVYGRLLFHGPSFRAIASIDASDPHATRATVRTPDPAGLLPDGAGRDLVLPVARLDASGQIATFAVIRDWTEEEVHLTFPTRLDRLEFAPGGEEPLRAVASVEAGPDQVRSDLEMMAADGRVVLRVLGRSENLMRIPGDFYAYWSSPRRVVLGRPLDSLFRGVPGSESCRVCEVGGAVGRLLINGLWSRALACMILDAGERRAFAALKLPSVPTAAWLLGRIAAKDAVRLLLGLDACMADVAIRSEGSGRPVAALSRGTAPLVSLAHKGSDVAVAVAGHPGHFAGVGIDVEPRRPLDPAVRDDAFAPAEHDRVAAAARTAGEPVDDWYLSAWCAKEAVGKALGRGVLGGPRNLEARAFDPASGRIEVALRGPMADAFPQDATSAGIAAYRRIRGSHVISLCLLPGTDRHPRADR